nr:response regulator transcription factor [Kineosporia sp. A_224]
MSIGAGATLRVLLVDDQQLVRSGFALMLSVEDDLEVVGEAADGAQAVERARETTPDVILMDVQMPVMDGIEATRRIVAENLGRVVILTTFDRDDYLFDALRAGASGFLLKNADPEQLVDAVRAAGHGQALLAPEVTLRVIERMTALSPVLSPADGAAHTSAPGSGAPATAAAHPARPTHPGLDRLTDRERQVLVLLGRGRSNAEIAGELYLGEATVKTHVSNVLAKLGVRDRVQAVVVAHESGLLRTAG